MNYPNTHHFSGGFYYFIQGWKLLKTPGIRRFVVIPLVVNILLLGGAFTWLFLQLRQWIPLIMSYVPDWLQWLSYLIWPVTVISIILVFSYFFSTLANIIAAPFCGLLAEQLEIHLTGKLLPDSGWHGMIKDIPRTMKREWQKLAYYLPRALLLIVLYFIPGIGQTIAPVLWFMFSAWMMAIQYCDFPFDNHKITFTEMRNTLNQRKVVQMQFGALVNLFTMIPLINLVIMPVAVCGATVMWVERDSLRLGRYE